MRLVRLSGFGAHGARPHVLIHEDTAPKPRSAIHPLLHLASLLCLLGSIVLTLLTLLLPSENYHLSVFSIEPLGSRIQAPPLVANASSSRVNGPAPTAIQLRKRVMSNVTEQGPWTGLDGPAIYVGVMQLCSKVNRNAKVNCTSISEAGTYDRLLPSELASTITSLPKSPLTPILLLAGGIATLLAVTIHLIGLALQISLAKNFGSFWRLKLWSKAPPLPPKDTGDSSSIIGLVEPGPTGNNVPGSYIASQVLTVIGLGLSVGAAVLELQAVHHADKAWDDAQEKLVGLKFSFGTATYLIVLIPVASLLAVLLCLISMMRKRSVKGPPVPVEKDDPEGKTGTTEPEISEAAVRAIEQEAEQERNQASDADTVQLRSAPARPPKSSLRRSARWSFFHAV